MNLHEMIYKIRNDADLSQEQFACIFGVTRQSVQKWERGEAIPEVSKIIKIAKYFDISIDSLLLGSDTRITEELKTSRDIQPKYANIHSWESYSSGLLTEYRQATEEGLDILQYKDTFEVISRLPKGEIKKKLGDILYEVVMSAPTSEGYKYVEPSELGRIRELRRGNLEATKCDRAALADRISGAWTGRICGCLLGKPIEGVRTYELHPLLHETGNWPLHRYLLKSDITDEICEKYRFRFANRCYADTVDGMPVDDDTNYTVLAQLVIEKYGRDFTSYDMSRAWLKYQPKDAYCTAERVAFCNFVNGYEPPESAIYKNPYREWIGAQIRGDYFGYINPGNPELAAEMAFRDASISHIKNGIYGEMFIAAMIAGAAITDSIEQIIEIGLGEIPCTSRLHEAVSEILEGYRAGISQSDCFTKIHKRYDEDSAHDWCHTVSNAVIVVASLLYGGGNFGRSICMAVETGFDTDCNGATVGSILGMAFGADAIGPEWTDPLRDTLHTSIFGVGTVRISDCIKKTLEHIPE